MYRPYLTLGAVFVLASFFRAHGGARSLGDDIGVDQGSEQAVDAESVYARGQRFPFSDAGLLELELIPKIGDSIAFELVKRREAIIEHSRRFSPRERWQAYLQVRGVGVQLARTLAERLSLPGDVTPIYTGSSALRVRNRHRVRPRRTISRINAPRRSAAPSRGTPRAERAPPPPSNAAAPPLRSLSRKLRSYRLQSAHSQGP